MYNSFILLDTSKTSTYKIIKTTSASMDVGNRKPQPLRLEITGSKTLFRKYIYTSIFIVPLIIIVEILRKTHVSKNK